MATWKLSFIVPHYAADGFADALGAAFEPEALAVSTSEANEGAATLVQTSSEWNEVVAHGDWRIEVLYADAPDMGAIRTLIAPIEHETGVDVAELAIEQMPEIDWVTKSLEGLDPVQAGRFFVHGSHDADKVPASAIPILVDAGQAFGTGHHETTMGCLEYISDIVRQGVRLNALDLGTGTGVLAIAIARLARCAVLASDIDPVAVRTARENARKNGVGSFVAAVAAAGFGHPALAARAPYDLIVANILARPLVSLAPAFRAHLRPGGTLVLSGILRIQEAMVTSAMRAQGLYLRSRKPMGDWVTLRIEG
ncbi:MAG: 50S ribosomal protein L11 methyltransferase [Parvibaculum sp.]|uniref:50S ribosomal protein L11 methyltransferase n=1 Tax=Parvibaculum sp. TaxID=2024848 RepID=UPI003C7169EA